MELEYGHYVVSTPFTHLFWESFSTAFLLSGTGHLISSPPSTDRHRGGSLSASSHSLPSPRQPWGFPSHGVGLLVVGLSGIGAAKRAVDEYALHLQYDQEYAREVWEHKLSPDGEVKEYCEYAVSVGASQKDAEAIGKLLVKHIELSVPYHLQTELNLVKPQSYGQIAERAAVVFFGYMGGCFAGLSVAKGIQDLCSEMSPLWCDICTSMALVCLYAGPLAVLQYSYLYRLRKFSLFQTRAAFTSGVILTIACFTRIYL